MSKRDEILERAADRRSFRLAAPAPTIKKRGRMSPVQEPPKEVRHRLPRSDGYSSPPAPRKKVAAPKPAKPVKVKKVRAPKPRLSREDRTEVMRQGVAARWIEDRPMPDVTTERCPGSGQAAATVEGHLLVCGTCGQRIGVAPPFTTPEHDREKQP